MYCSIACSSTSSGPIIFEMNLRRSISACNRFPLSWADCRPSPCARGWLSVSWPDNEIKGSDAIYGRGVFDVGWLLLVAQCHRIQPQPPGNSINIVIHDSVWTNKQTDTHINTTCQSITQHFIYVQNSIFCKGDMFRPYKIILRPSKKTNPRVVYIHLSGW